MTVERQDWARWSPYLLTVVLVLGGWLRATALDTQGYWHDEIYSVAHLSGFDAYLFPGSDLDAAEPARPVSEWLEALGQERYRETVPRNVVHEGHPPLYQLGLKAWTGLFGRSMWVIRAFSLVPGLLTIGILYLLALLFWGHREGVVAATLTAVNPFQVYFSAEARSYSWTIFFSALALFAICRLWSTPGRQSHGWMALWWASVVAASYTHYYAGLYCGALFLLSLPTSKLPRQLLKLSVPFLAFAPWLLVLRRQLALHSDTHWTTGAPSLVASIQGFLNGTLDQLTGVFASAGAVERGAALVVVLAALAIRVRRRPNSQPPLGLDRVFLSVPVFVVLVVLVDALTNHHTILVPRYWSSALPALTLLAASVACRPRVGAVLLILLITVNANASVETARGARAPKQMLREAAAYVAQRYEDGDVVLVTPSGPTLIGLAMYLPRHVLLGASRPEDSQATAEALAQTGRSIWLVAQRLGVYYELQPTGQPNLGPPVRFAGLDVWHVERSPQP